MDTTYGTLQENFLDTRLKVAKLTKEVERKRKAVEIEERLVSVKYSLEDNATYKHYQMELERAATARDEAIAEVEEKYQKKEEYFNEQIALLKGRLEAKSSSKSLLRKRADLEITLRDLADTQKRLEIAERDYRDFTESHKND